MQLALTPARAATSRARSRIRPICSSSSLARAFCGAVAVGELVLLVRRAGGGSRCRRPGLGGVEVGQQAGGVAAELADGVRHRPQRRPSAASFLPSSSWSFSCSALVRASTTARSACSSRCAMNERPVSLAAQHAGVAAELQVARLQLAELAAEVVAGLGDQGDDLAAVLAGRWRRGSCGSWPRRRRACGGLLREPAS